ncbi:hypothetical protein B6U99_02960 [Candidatus Geothermarchaeota archaeon ex4572_27]|nr:MAG: hypothetical protein B6U99_02960 [Candidatus Geothermarchaeota archaeon ex4572_27]
MAWFKTTTYNLALWSPMTLLPPPEEGEGIPIGEDVYRRKVYLNPSRLPNFHGIFLGPTGSGKSTTAESLLYDLVEMGINVVCIDPGEDYVEAVRELGGDVVDLAERPPDIFEWPGDPEVWLQEVSAAFRYSMGLGEEQVAALAEALREEFEGSRSVDGLLARLEGEALSDIYLGEAYVRLKGVLERLRRPGIGVGRLLSRGRPVDIVFGRGERRLGHEFEKLATLLLVSQINEYRVVKGPVHRVDLVVVVDEAWRLLRMPGHERDLINSLRMMRKYGVAYWLVTQSAGDLPPEAYEQFGFTLALSGPRIHAMRLDLISRLSEEDVEWLTFSKRPGYGLLIRLGYPRPARIRVLVRDCVLRRRGVSS